MRNRIVSRIPPTSVIRQDGCMGFRKPRVPYSRVRMVDSVEFAARLGFGFKVWMVEVGL